MARYGNEFHEWAVARLETVIARVAMNEAQRSAWCCGERISPSDLQQWHESAMAALAQHTRNSNPITVVIPNPERDAVIRTANGPFWNGATR